MDLLTGLGPGYPPPRPLAKINLDDMSHYPEIMLFS